MPDVPFLVEEFLYSALPDFLNEIRPFSCTKLSGTSCLRPEIIQDAGAIRNTLKRKVRALCGRGFIAYIFVYARIISSAVERKQVQSRAFGRPASLEDPARNFQISQRLALDCLQNAEASLPALRFANREAA